MSTRPANLPISAVGADGVVSAAAEVTRESKSAETTMLGERRNGIKAFPGMEKAEHALSIVGCTVPAPVGTCNGPSASMTFWKFVNRFAKAGSGFIKE